MRNTHLYERVCNANCNLFDLKVGTLINYQSEPSVKTISKKLSVRIIGQYFWSEQLVRAGSQN